MKDAEKWARQEEMLNRRRNELMRRLETIGEELDQPMNRDDEDRAVEREADEVLEDLGAAGQRELVAIDAALTQFRDGRYGICAICGDEIPEKRLQAVPTTTFCLECA